MQGDVENLDGPLLHSSAEYFLSGRVFTLISSWKGANAVSSFAMCSTTPWNMVVLPGDTTLMYNSLWMQTSHFMTFWREVS